MAQSRAGVWFRAFRSSNPTGEVRLSRSLAGMHILVLSALIVLVVTSLLWVSQRHNELARASTAKMVQTAARTFTQKTAIVVRDYSIWDEAVEAVATRDLGWLYSNLGSAAAEIGTLDLLHVYEPATGWSAGWVEGTPTEGVTGLLDAATLAALEARLAATDPVGHPVITAFAEADGAIWAYAITRIVPTSEVDPAVPEAAYARQIHGLMLADWRLAEIGGALLIEDLHLAFAVEAGLDAVPLPGLDGQPVAYLVWTPPSPGAQILRQIALPIGLGLLAAVAIALVSSRFAVRSARRLETALTAAQAADRAKMEFLSNVSHELRTPMNGILGVIQLFEMTRLDAEQGDLVRILKSSADTQMELIGDLLDAISLENGGRQLHPEPMVATDVVTEVFRMLRPGAEEKGLTMRLHSHPTAAMRVEGDARAIRQIITNLIGNAVKFTARGSVEIRVEAEARSGGLELSMAVTDTGPGIAPADQERIFDRFAKADSAALRNSVDGIGLGLAISRSLAQRMGGRITLRSTPGAGSTFTFTVRLPLVHARAPGVAEAA